MSKPDDVSRNENSEENIVDAQSSPPSSVKTGKVDMNDLSNHKLTRAVFYPSAVILLVLVAMAIVIPDQLNAAISWMSTAVINNLSWYYVLAATGFVVFALVVAFTRFGNTKLGDDDDEPEYSVKSWFAMLFAAGMGIGLVFYGAGEPMSHFASPRPGVEGNESELARDALASTFLHWGLHPWAIYVVVGLAIAYFHFRKKRPISIRWTLEPVFGKKRVEGGLGHTIDSVAILGTVLGIATSLGFGVNQVAAGIEYLTGFKSTTTVLVVLVIVISALAATSVATGLDNGIQFLSNLNLIMAALLAFVVAALGPTVFILNEFVQDVGIYLANIVELSFTTLPFQGVEGTTWLTSWTTYYWGWWISWSPFVGVFIARISRGRTIREFIIGVLAVPTLVTFMWFAIMGGNALYQQMFGEGGLIGDNGLVNVNTILFQSFEPLPAAQLLSGLAMVIVVIFFITSSDSGSYVMSMLSTGGNPNPALYVRLTWATLVGAVTAAMIGASAGDTGMAALQSLAILAALPFSFVMIAMCVAVWRSLQGEHKKRQRAERAMMERHLVSTVQARVEEGLEESVAATAEAAAVEVAVEAASAAAVEAAASYVARETDISGANTAHSSEGDGTGPGLGGSASEREGVVRALGSSLRSPIPVAPEVVQFVRRLRRKHRDDK
ncbi:MAG: BCCT family transporter [Actinomycetaceae bacterium]|nr:BCCT family transporter [Actinomycetaceae bacterium]